MKGSGVATVHAKLHRGTSGSLLDRIKIKIQQHARAADKHDAVTVSVGNPLARHGPEARVTLEGRLETTKAAGQLPPHEQQDHADKGDNPGLRPFPYRRPFERSTSLGWLRFTHARVGALSTGSR